MKLRSTRRWFFASIILACILWVAPRSLAQSASSATNFQLTVSTDRKAAIYKQHEPVTFLVQLLQNGQPTEAEVEWLTSKDGLAPTNSGRLRLTNGSGSISGKLDEPGFLSCRVTFRPSDGKPVTALAGAGVDPLRIKPSLPVPRDFDRFWAAQKKRLAAVPVNARLTPVKSPEQGVACFDLQADSVGAPVSGYFAKPESAQPRSLPIILTVHGAGVRSSSLGGAADWARRGFLALDINAHGIPNGKPEQFYADLANGELRDYRTQGRESREQVYFLGMFLRLVRANDFLTAQPEWNGKILVVHGSSQGGAQSIVAAGLDKRVTFFAAGVPAMCDHTGAAAGRISGWPKFVPLGPDGRPDPQVQEVARYYDAMNFAARTKAPGILTVGFIDTTCPPTSVYAAYHALKSRKKIFNDPPSTHAVSQAAAQAMRDAIMQHAGLKPRAK